MQVAALSCTPCSCSNCLTKRWPVPGMVKKTPTASRLHCGVRPRSSTMQILSLSGRQAQPEQLPRSEDVCPWLPLCGTVGRASPACPVASIQYKSLCRYRLCPVVSTSRMSTHGTIRDAPRSCVSGLKIQHPWCGRLASGRVMPVAQLLSHHMGVVCAFS